MNASILKMRLPGRQTGLDPAVLCCERLDGVSAHRETWADHDGDLPRIVPVLPSYEREFPAQGEARHYEPALPPALGRRLAFRCLRLLLAGGLALGAAAYTRYAWTRASSEIAYIHAEMIMLRAPIEGELHLAPAEPGVLIAQGTTLFRVENPRSGNQEVTAQRNWLRELAERLHGEVAEAAVNLRQHEQIYESHRKLFEAKLISRLAFVEVASKRTLAETALASKQNQARQAETRAAEMERQVQLRSEAQVRMPFDGVVWTTVSKSGTPIAAYEPVMQVIRREETWVEAFFHEKHASKLRPGAHVRIRVLDGSAEWEGEVDSVRGAVGRIAFGNLAAMPEGSFAPRRVAVRVRMDGSCPYGASEFFGVGRSVIVTLP